MLVYIAVSEHCFSQFKLFPLAQQYLINHFLTNKKPFINFTVKLTKINYNKYFLINLFIKIYEKKYEKTINYFYKSKYATFKILLRIFC